MQTFRLKTGMDIRLNLILDLGNRWDGCIYLHDTDTNM